MSWCKLNMIVRNSENEVKERQHNAKSQTQLKFVRQETAQVVSKHKRQRNTTETVEYHHPLYLFI